MSMPAGEPCDYEVAPDMTLRGERFGSPQAPPLVLLHGGGQTRHAWGEAGPALARRGWQVLAIDQRGHGESDWSEFERYGFEHYVDDFLRVLATLPQPPVLIGASLGGLVGLLAQGERSEPLLRALVLVDIVPDMSMRGRERVHRFMLGRQAGFATLDEAAQAVADYLPQRRRPTDREGLLKNLRQRPDGRWYWHWDRRLMEVLTRNPLDAGRLRGAAAALRLPTLLVRGALSDIVTPEAAQAFLELVPHAEFTEVEGAGHMVAGDRNDVFLDAVTAFLERFEASPDSAAAPRAGR